MGTKTSIWHKEVALPQYPSWNGNGRTEVVVIGGGLSGILTACFLKEAGKKVILLEADRLCSGQTGRTTAKITSQHGLFYGKYQERLGTERLHFYASANEKAIACYRRLVEERGIECDWMDCDSYLYAANAQKEMRIQLEQEWKEAVHAGIFAELVTGEEFPGGEWLKGKGTRKELLAVRFLKQAAFHPLKLIASLLANLSASGGSLDIYEHSEVREVEEHRVSIYQKEVSLGTIEAEQIVFACHYPFLYRPGYYFLRLHQERSYVLAVKSQYRSQFPALYYPADNNGLSIRPCGEYLLLGGMGHRTGEQKGNPYERLAEMAREIDPEYEEICRYSAQDTISLDEIPYIGMYAPSRPSWYVATGFKKWGMTHAMIAAVMITEQVTEKYVPTFRKEEQEVFAPSRFLMSASAKQLAEEGLQVTAGLAKSITSPPRCTHLGCHLVWNETEKSWDCPCHGSRFQEETGEVLDGPAIHPIKLSGKISQKSKKEPTD